MHSKIEFNKQLEYQWNSITQRIIKLFIVSERIIKPRSWNSTQSNFTLYRNQRIKRSQNLRIRKYYITIRIKNLRLSRKRNTNALGVISWLNEYKQQ